MCGWKDRGQNFKCGLKTGVIRPEILTCGWSLDSEETGGKMWGGGICFQHIKTMEWFFKEGYVI